MEEIMGFQWTPERLLAARRTLGLSQRKAGELIGATAATISHIENGHVTNPLILLGYGTLLIRYMTKLQHTPDAYFSGKDVYWSEKEVIDFLINEN